MQKVGFIADIGSNHNGDINRAVALVLAAHNVGCSAVKIQYFRGLKLYSKEFPALREKMYQRELPDSFLPIIWRVCHENGMALHVTPFHSSHVSMLTDYADEFKIGSYEILNEKLIMACAVTRKPIAISCGLAFADEAREAFRAARHYSPQVFIYHCNSHYPAKPKECNLGLIKELRVWYTNVGWSDHTGSPSVIHRAVALGAKRIEFHLDLEYSGGNEAEHGHCWTPAAIKTVIDAVGLGEIAEGKSPYYESHVEDIQMWRMDVEDEARPLKQYREALRAENNTEESAE